MVCLIQCKNTHSFHNYEMHEIVSIVDIKRAINKATAVLTGMNVTKMLHNNSQRRKKWHISLSCKKINKHCYA